jgi:5-methylcytosine-specific restriction endonuclease McrA
VFLEVYPQVLGVSTHKACIKCGELKPATTEYFYVDHGNLRLECKVCNAAKSREWYAANRDRKADWDKAYRAAHPGEAAQKTRAWREANPGRDAINNKAYRLAHPEKKSAQHKAWKAANPDKVKANHNRRRARKAGNGGDYTAEDAAAIRAAQTDKQGRLICWKCGKPIKGTPHLDHWQPLKHGGPNSAGNLHYLHARCNLEKGTKLPAELGRLL